MRHVPRDAVRWLKAHANLVALHCFPAPKPGVPHNLPAPLVCSVTSHPPRFRWLAVSLRRMLAQDMRPDAVVLWLARGDGALLPAAVTGLTTHGLTIRECDDVKSYNKLVPALAAYPDAFIVTADDDVVYPRGWLRRFVDEYRRSDEILCQKARRITLCGNRIAPYGDWPIIDGTASGPDVFPLGVGGVLYPPGALIPEASNSTAFLRLCPRADDAWFFWMTREHIRRRVITSAGRSIRLPSQQIADLWSLNKSGGNDRQIAALVAVYGVSGPLSGATAATTLAPAPARRKRA